MFSFMSLNARGKPLETREVIINLIAGTTTTTGLRLRPTRRPRVRKGITVSDARMATVNITRDEFHGE